MMIAITVLHCVMHAKVSTSQAPTPSSTKGSSKMTRWTGKANTHSAMAESIQGVPAASSFDSIAAPSLTRDMSRPY